MSYFAPNVSITADAFSPPHVGFGHSHLIGLGLAFSLGFIVLGRLSPLTKSQRPFPLVTLEQDGNQVSNFRRDWLLRGTELLEKGRAEHPGQPFRLRTDNGDLVVLPPRMANEIRNVDELSFMETLKHNFQTSLPGFEPFKASSRSDALLQVVTRKQLTKSLSTDDLGSR